MEVVPMKKLVSVFSAAVVLVVAATVAFAADPLPAHSPIAEAAAGSFVQALTGTVFPLLAAGIVGLVGWAFRKLAVKWHMEGLLVHQDLVEKAALQGISLAEERAAAMVKNSLAQKLTGREKLALAIGHVTSVVPNVSIDQATNIVKALLARIPGVGATGDSAVASPGNILGGFALGRLDVPEPAEPEPPIEGKAPAAAGFARVGLMVAMLAAVLALAGLSGCATCYNVSQSGDGSKSVRTDARQTTDMDGTANVPFSGGSVAPASK
jgi:hypothetical protein